MQSITEVTRISSVDSDEVKDHFNVTDTRSLLSPSIDQFEANPQTTVVFNQTPDLTADSQESVLPEDASPAVSSFRSRALIGAVSVLAISYLFPATIAYFVAAAAAYGLYKGFNVLNNRFFPETTTVTVTEPPVNSQNLVVTSTLPSADNTNQNSSVISRSNSHTSINQMIDNSINQSRSDSHTRTDNSNTNFTNTENNSTNQNDSEEEVNKLINKVETNLDDEVEQTNNTRSRAPSQS